MNHRFRLLRFLHILFLDILSLPPQLWQVRRRGVCRLCRHGHPELLPPSLHLLLLCDIQKGRPAGKEAKWNGNQSCDRYEQDGDSLGEFGQEHYKSSQRISGQWSCQNQRKRKWDRSELERDCDEIKKSLDFHWWIRSFMTKGFAKLVPRNTRR